MIVGIGTQLGRTLSGQKDFTLDSLVATAFDPYLTSFDGLLPPLFEAYRATPVSDPLKVRLTDQIEALEHWDRRWSVDSAPTALAIYFAQELWRTMQADPGSDSLSVLRQVATESNPEQRLRALAAASYKLTMDFKSWKTPWGEINRFQRLAGDIVQPFNDGAPSIPVGFTSGTWGSLAAFEAKTYPGTKQMYGTSGNSFVAVARIRRCGLRMAHFVTSISIQKISKNISPRNTILGSEAGARMRLKCSLSEWIGRQAILTCGHSKSS